MAEASIRSSAGKERSEPKALFEKDLEVSMERQRTSTKQGVGCLQAGG
jgi:hypothetical protein